MQHWLVGNAVFIDNHRQVCTHVVSNCVSTPFGSCLTSARIYASERMHLCRCTQCSSRTMPSARVIPWPKAFPPPLDGDALHKCRIAMRWRNLVQGLLYQHYNHIMTYSLAHIVHARARDAVVVQHQLTLTITDLPFEQLSAYLGRPEHEVIWLTCRSLHRWAHLTEKRSSTLAVPHHSSDDLYII